MKYRILEELKSKSNGYLSGEEISRKFGISRTAVWKYINKLRDEGYGIESQTNNGYRLVDSPDSLSPVEVLPLLETEFLGREVIYLDSIDSTNAYAKKAAENTFWDGTVVIADEQTCGRGRLGRQWISPKGKGIWMSMLLKPDILPSDASKITLVAAYAVCRALEDCCKLDAKIKWPNDIVVNGKKLCGILTEMSADIDEIKYVVVGIGINANLDLTDFGDEVASIATSLKIEAGKSVKRKVVAASVLNEFEKVYKSFVSNASMEDFLEEYKSRSAVLGKDIKVIYKKEEMTGKAVDISPEGHLIVQLPDGSKKAVVSGEVSVRGLYGFI
ncbi:MAG: biotin--[acetyl-CoA-carboxylase] ligase [Caulobacteraceae bacterium]